MGPRARLLVLSLATVVLVSPAAPVLAGSKYGTPKSGAWRVDSLFDDTKGGSMTLSKAKKVTKLTALTGAEADESCGTKVELASTPKLKSYAKASGRWALAGVSKSGLFVPTSTKLEVDGRRTNGKIKLLFSSPTLGTPAQITYGDCTLNFTLRKK